MDLLECGRDDRALCVEGRLAGDIGETAALATCRRHNRLVRLVALIDILVVRATRLRFAWRLERRGCQMLGARRAGGDGEARRRSGPRLAELTGDELFVLQDHEPLDHVFELANVARPIVVEEALPQVLRQRTRGTVVAIR